MLIKIFTPLQPSRGFNAAINGSNDGSWSVLSFEGFESFEDVIFAFNSTENVFRAKASIPLQVQKFTNIYNYKTITTLNLIICHFYFQNVNVSPAVLISFLREHWSEWADFAVEAYSVVFRKGASYPGMRPRLIETQKIAPLSQKHE